MPGVLRKTQVALARCRRAAVFEAWIGWMRERYALELRGYKVRVRCGRIVARWDQTRLFS